MRRSSQSSSLLPPLDPRGILSRIQHCDYVRDLFVNPVVDPVRESLRKKPEVVATQRMNSGKQLNRTNV